MKNIQYHRVHFKQNNTFHGISIIVKNRKLFNPKKLKFFPRFEFHFDFSIDIKWVEEARSFPLLPKNNKLEPLHTRMYIKSTLEYIEQKRTCVCYFNFHSSIHSIHLLFQQVYNSLQNLLFPLRHFYSMTFVQIFFYFIRKNTIFFLLLSTLHTFIHQLQE